jgi:hypothetical protein
VSRPAELPEPPELPDVEQPTATPDEARRILADFARALDQPAPKEAAPFSLTSTHRKPKTPRNPDLFEKE